MVAIRLNLPGGVNGKWFRWHRFAESFRMPQTKECCIGVRVQMFEPYELATDVLIRRKDCVFDESGIISGIVY